MPDRSLAAANLALAALAAGVVASCSGEPTAFQRPESPPQRIVAGSVLAAETLLAIAPRDRIAAVHVFATQPWYSLVTEEARGLPVVGAEPADLLSVRPDLVIVDAFTRPETIAILAAADVPVLCTANPTSFDVILENVRRIGRACHLEVPAEQLVARTEARLAELAERGRELGGWQLMSLDGAYHTYGRGSLFDAITRAAGARNLAAERGAGPFRKLDLEAVLAWRAPVLAIGVPATQAVAKHRPEWLDQSPGLALVPAVKNDRLLLVPTAMFNTTSHHLVDTVDYVQRQLLAWGRE
ncbi:MAG: ABC transporter substrate-binding protein [bacterium]|nr:ABC transporter substrate-binding protein [bacterium]